MINEYSLYITLAITITTIPGPSVALVVKNSIKHGYGIAIAGTLGNFFAMLLLAILSALGLGAVIMASATAYGALKIGGCLYLVYLGIKAWTAPEIRQEIQITPQKKTPNKSTKSRAVLSVMQESFTVGIANPKAIAFFTALFPQFIDSSRAYVPQFFTLIFTIEGISFLVLSSYALAASQAAPLFFRNRVMGWFNKMTGMSFIGFGVAMLHEK